MEPEDRERFVLGIRLFNDGEYLEAHEQFEELWMERGGHEADCLKGLIQATVALHHATCANPSGARKLLTSFKDYLSCECEDVLPLAVEPFITAVTSCLEAYLEQPRGTRLDPRSTPHIAWDERFTG